MRSPSHTLCAHHAAVVASTIRDRYPNNRSGGPRVSDQGLIDARPIAIVTRAGVLHGEFLPEGRIRVTMGVPTIAAE